MFGLQRMIGFSALLINKRRIKRMSVPNLIELLLACFLVSSCGMVVSTQPLFDRRDAEVLQPRQGLWALVEPECHFNTSSAPAQWPNCAQALIVQDGVAVNAKPHTPKNPLDGPIAFNLSGGSPGVIQIARPISKDFRRWGHGYFGYRPLSTDAEGKVVSARVWPAFCTRPNPRGRATTDCWTPSAQEVRLALQDSEIWAYEDHISDLGLTAVWVRYAHPSR